MTPATIRADSETCPREFGELERYWNDPAYAAELDRETQMMRDQVNALLDASIARARAAAPVIAGRE